MRASNTDTLSLFLSFSGKLQCDWLAREQGSAVSFSKIVDLTWWFRSVALHYASHRCDRLIKTQKNSSCCICIVVVFAWNKCENALFKKPSTREQLLQRNSGLAHRVFSALSPPLLVSQEEAGRWTISPFQHNIPSLSLTYITRELRTIKAGRVSWN